MDTGDFAFALEAKVRRFNGYLFKDRTDVVFAALMRGGPTDAETLARAFKQGAKVEPSIARILAAMARLGHAYSPDGRKLALSRAA